MKHSGLFSLVGFILVMFWFGLEPSNPNFIKAASVQIQTRSCVGSGTIVKTFKENDYYVSYIISAAHLTDIIGRHNYIVVDFYYLDQTKFKKSYIGNLVWLHLNNRGIDYSIIEVVTIEKPIAVKISENCSFTIGEKLTSIGFDNKASEANVYSVRYLSDRKDDIFTIFDTPRPGRSGGGLFFNNKLVGVCWGYMVKSNLGLFTSLEALRESISNSPYKFILERD